jgi:hypothetical protein
MKFGKRRWESKLDKDASDEKTVSDNPALESWTVRGDDEPAVRSSFAPPVHGEHDVGVADEPPTVVEGDAVELPMTEVAADDEPVAVAEPLPDSEPEPETAHLPPEPLAAAAAPEPAAAAAEPEIVLSQPLPPPAPKWAPSPPAPAPMPYPAAEEPVLVYSSAATDPPAATPLGEAGAAHATGHAAGSGMSPSWPEPVMALAAERPEVVVGAAFAGGVLLAMILRRLGN